jgi:hypothetical protein
MTLFRIHNNEGVFYIANVSIEQIREAMYEYVKRKRAEGKSFSSIIYTYCPLRVVYRPPK